MMLDSTFPPINWQKTLKIARWVAILTLLLYLGLESSAAIDANSDRVMAYQKISAMIQQLAVLIIDFARPFVEVILLLMLVDWAVRRFNIQLTIPPFADWKVEPTPAPPQQCAPACRKQSLWSPWWIGQCQ